MNSLFAIVVASLLWGGFSWLVWRDFAPTGRGFRRAGSARRAAQLRNVILTAFALIWVYNLVALIRHPLA